MIRIKGFANFQRTVRNLIAEDLKCINLTFRVKEISIVKNIDKPLIVFIACLNTRLCLIVVVVRTPAGERQL